MDILSSRGLIGRMLGILANASALYSGRISVLLVLGGASLLGNPECKGECCALGFLHSGESAWETAAGQQLRSQVISATLTRRLRSQFGMNIRNIRLATFWIKQRVNSFCLFRRQAISASLVQRI